MEHTHTQTHAHTHTRTHTHARTRVLYLVCMICVCVCSHYSSSGPGSPADKTQRSDHSGAPASTSMRSDSIVRNAQQGSFQSFPGWESVPITAIMKRIAVGQAGGRAGDPHRTMLNHADVSQSRWDSGQSMSIEGWNHHLDFWAFAIQMPGTIRIAVGQAYWPHRALLNHPGKSQREWNSGASMTYAGWQHHTEFWAYPSSMPGTICIAVEQEGQAMYPHRMMINHSEGSQSDWDEGKSMTYRDWNQYMEFWVFPVPGR